MTPTVPFTTVPEAGDCPVSCFVLAGGEGERLRPLTRTVPKPLVSFGAVHRLLDFTLSNVRNSGLRRAHVLSQYRNADIGRHIRLFWSDPDFGSATKILNQPPVSGKRYRGTADAVRQNLEYLPAGTGESDPVLVLSADHVYRMDYRKLIAHHRRTRGSATVAAIHVPVSAASHFGVITADRSGRIRSFDEKPESPQGQGDDPGGVLANMGVYVFERSLLRRAFADLERVESALDFGRHVLPWMVRRGLAGAWRVSDSGDSGYWRDVGTLVAYHECQMELVDGQIGFDTLDARWPVQATEARIVQPHNRSMIAASAAIGDAWVERSVVGSGVVIEDGADVRGSVLLEGARVGTGAAIRNLIVAGGARVQARDTIGFDSARDLERFGAEAAGVAVVPPGPRERVHVVSSISGRPGSRIRVMTG